MINVFNIEKFATHDGPGIRTTIFLKGCNLHCPWCANPESWSIKPTLMYDLRKCIKCKKCVNVCKQKAISFDKKFLYDRLKCIYCKKCSESCLTQALTFAGKELSINTIVDEVMKDKDYFDNSNGGITISGGEPFVQFEAMIKLIKALKKQNLHIAIETTGNYPLEYLKQALPYLDLLLFDVKHSNHQKIKEVIGGNPKLIFNNLKFLGIRGRTHQVDVVRPLFHQLFKNGDEAFLGNNLALSMVADGVVLAVNAAQGTAGKKDSA